MSNPTQGGGTQRPKITITSDDLKDNVVGAVADHLKRAQEIPLIREVGEAKRSYDGLLTIGALVLGGIVAGLATWGLWNLLPQESDSTTSNLQAAFTLTLSIAILLTVADSAMSRSMAKVGVALLWTTPTALVLALGLGYLANFIYGNLVQDTFTSLVNQGLDPNSNSFWTAFAGKNHLNRGIAWSLLGLAAGVSIGISSRSPRRIIITGLGGLVGGFLGGFAFDFFSGEATAQSVGLAITGAVVGLSVSGLEQVSKSSWIEITQGGMAGKQFILYQANVTVGSSPSANVTLIKDPGIAPIAATIKRFGKTVTIVAADRNVPISVNGVAGFEHKLVEGSVIQLGATELKFREKSLKINDSGIVRG
jgi:Inner membrane component of T3SS, cytoplasmic domain